MRRTRGRSASAPLVALASIVVLTLTGCMGARATDGMVDARQAAHSPRPTPTASLPPTALSAPLSAAQQSQVDYALQYWKNYNTPVYGDDNPNGGDCANFVSQTLIQRGWKMNSLWYNHGPGRMSPDWAFVPAMQNYFTANAASLGLQQLGPADRTKYAVGDVVVFWWQNASGGYSASPDHVQVIDRITSLGGQVKVEMASHNEDYQYRDLDDEITNQHPGAKFMVWHLTKDTN